MNTPVVSELETYLRDYVCFADSNQTLPIALWIVGTHCFESFDAYPYMVITSATKRSGKTRLSELIGFTCSNPVPIAAMTGPTVFRLISDKTKPTLICDEAEAVSSEAAGTMRSVLNVGYRKGQTVPRVGNFGIEHFETYCPKVFCLIGDVYDTLRDRSIVVNLYRGIPSKRFLYSQANAEGETLRTAARKAVKAHLEQIESAYLNSAGLPFLTGRDEEIWMSLFAICSVLCPERLRELKTASVDLSTEKTAEARRYIQLEKHSSADQDDEYAQRLLTDLYSLMVTTASKITTESAILQLKSIPEAPWRKYRGSGLDAKQMSHMLSRFKGLTPKRIRVGYGRDGSKTLRGYLLSDVQRAMKEIGR